MAGSRDFLLVDAVMAHAPGTTVDDAVWATRAQGATRTVAVALAVGLLVLAYVLDRSWLTVVMAIAAVLIIPLLTQWSRPPYALALTGDVVQVFASERFTKRLAERIDTVPAPTLSLESPGLFSDHWKVGDHRVTVARSIRSRLEAWSDGELSDVP